MSYSNVNIKPGDYRGLNNSIKIENLGRRDYRQIWEYQKELFDKRLNGEIQDTLLLVEHDPVYTIGRTGSESNILNDSKAFNRQGIPVIHIDRGGSITFHGPGQLVGYPVIKLSDYYCDVHRYLRDIEEVLILTLADFGVKGVRETGKTGVWVNGKKVAAIGVKVTRWITMHGFALNVSTDLDYFDNIIPCGIKDRKVTSLNEILGAEVSLKITAESIAKNFRTIFDIDYQKSKNSLAG